MSFIFGLLIGSMAAGGGHSLPPALGSIPFRCLAAFEISEGDYRTCRYISLRRELIESCMQREVENREGHCSLDKHFAWEIAALRELKKSIEAKASQTK